MTKNARVWLVVAVIAGVIGLCSGFFSFIILGAAASGSGCSGQCSVLSNSAAAIGMFFLGGAIVSAFYSVFLIWTKKEQAPRLWGKIIMTIVNLFVALLAGSSFILLVSISG